MKILKLEKYVEPVETVQTNGNVPNCATYPSHINQFDPYSHMEFERLNQLIQSMNYERYLQHRTNPWQEEQDRLEYLKQSYMIEQCSIVKLEDLKIINE